jgi:exopolysaccharide biosynthesis protein
MKPLYLMLILAAISPTHYLHCNIAGVPVHQVMVNLASKDLRVTVCIAKRGIGYGETFDAMTARLAPVAAITGGFYDTRTLKPIGDIVLDSKVIHDGCIGPVLLILKNGIAQIVSQAEYNKIPRSTIRVGVQTGPTLVKGGKILCTPAAEGFHHIAQTAIRTAVGITDHNKLIMLATGVPTTLKKLAEVMLEVGCTSAVALDGGSSTALYADGEVKVRPIRVMTSILVILPSKSK